MFGEIRHQEPVLLRGELFGRRRGRKVDRVDARRPRGPANGIQPNGPSDVDGLGLAATSSPSWVPGGSVQLARRRRGGSSGEASSPADGSLSALVAEQSPARRLGVNSPRLHADAKLHETAPLSHKQCVVASTAVVRRPCRNPQSFGIAPQSASGVAGPVNQTAPYLALSRGVLVRSHASIGNRGPETNERPASSTSMLSEERRWCNAQMNASGRTMHLHGTQARPVSSDALHTARR
jgi:hypothetical protein